jgi:dipeptidyl aminopeptidase/acylaminoacyl peptidase
VKKLIPLYLLVCILIGVLTFKFFIYDTPAGRPFRQEVNKIVPKPLEKYTFKNLKSRTPQGGEIKLTEKIIPEKTTAISSSSADINSYIFEFTTEGKRATGLLNMPQKAGNYPVIVMFRGYVDKSIYAPGIGTKRAGEVYTKNGYITLAPDFLGYGGSDNPSIDSIEERFQTYTTSLDLLDSLKTLNSALAATNSGIVKADIERLGFWGHSNGGHISLSILAITEKPIPTVLWNPVSKHFPYSILFFTDEFDDQGKSLRKVVADFEDLYNIDEFSPPNYYESINAPIQLHQGSADDAVPQRWSDQLSEKLKELKKDTTYFVYPGADHNLAPNGWNLAVERSLQFYDQTLKK